eukprot:77140-Rhodomonas_salina.1
MSARITAFLFPLPALAPSSRRLLPPFLPFYPFTSSIRASTHPSIPPSLRFSFSPSFFPPSHPQTWSRDEAVPLSSSPPNQMQGPITSVQIVPNMYCTALNFASCGRLYHRPCNSTGGGVKPLCFYDCTTAYETCGFDDRYRNLQVPVRHCEFNYKTLRAICTRNSTAFIL